MRKADRLIHDAQSPVCFRDILLSASNLFVLEVENSVKWTIRRVGRGAGV
jgi:hypothetical protein